jgi:D-serine dehydratase
MNDYSPSLPDGLASLLRSRQPLLWLNPSYGTALPPSAAGCDGILAAADRFARCRRLLCALFPQMSACGGTIESELLPAAELQRALGGDPARDGAWYLKADHQLPIAGSIKARGGFHEVLAHAEALAIEHGLARPGGDLIALAEPQARALYSRHKVAVGSTGNLGLSIGIMAAALGFAAVVHMSVDAKGWKKTILRERGVRVVEHGGDYAAAVAAGRAGSEADPLSYFVDDESSTLLFYGYAAAAQRLVEQLHECKRPPSADHPVFVYLPCGVGGAPGGITFGLKRLLGEHVHCFFAEPVASPCMLVQLASGESSPMSVYDAGLDNKTDADGLAVPLASPLVSPIMHSLLSGVFTVSDDALYVNLNEVWKAEGLEIEPSAAAGIAGPAWLLESETGRSYLAKHDLSDRRANITHVIWSTGGGLLPASDHARFRATAKQYG